MVTTRSGQAVFGDRTLVMRRRKRREIVQPTLSPTGILYVPGFETPRRQTTSKARPSIKAATSKRDQSPRQTFPTTTIFVESDTITRPDVSTAVSIPHFIRSCAFWNSIAVCLRFSAFIKILHLTVRTFPAPGATSYLFGHIVCGMVYYMEWVGSKVEKDTDGTILSDGAITLSVFYVSELVWIVWSQVVYLYLKVQD